MSTLSLIDLSSIFWQTWHATGDQEVGAAYDATLRKIYKCINGSDLVAIAIDRPPYKRKAVYQPYKAQRDTPSELALEQLRRLIEQLDNTDGFPVLGADGYEADDIIATVIANITRADYEINIYTGDKDLMQLATDNTIIISVQTGEQYDSSAVFEKFGVLPSELGNLLALTGDKSDNVPGVPGIGPKKAVALLEQFPFVDLLNLIDIGDPDNQIQPPSVRQALLDNQMELIASRKLVTLFDDAPIDVDSIFKTRESKPMEENDTKTNEGQSASVAESIMTPSESAQIVHYNNSNWSLALEPANTDSAIRVSRILFESRLYAKFPNAQSIFAVIMRGRSLGLDATTALDGFHVVEGQPTLSATLTAGLILNSGKAKYFSCIETTDKIATYETWRVGDPKPVRLSFTIEEAERAGLLALTKRGNETNWHKRPKTMLRHRCETELGHMVYPDVTAGLYTPDEISAGQLEI